MSLKSKEVTSEAATARLEQKHLRLSQQLQTTLTLPGEIPDKFMICRIITEGAITTRPAFMSLKTTYFRLHNGHAQYYITTLNPSLPVGAGPRVSASILLVVWLTVVWWGTAASAGAAAAVVLGQVSFKV